VEAALSLAEPEGNLRAFIDEGPEMAALLRIAIKESRHVEFARQILSSFPEEARFPKEAGIPDEAAGIEAPAQREPAVLREPLTDRELDVLRLIADGLKYEEIAERLVISLNTVRFYVKQVYGKLGVNNRTKANEVARRAGVL
jgi:LuxR family maltose regulon positive regulatory protein